MGEIVIFAHFQYFIYAYIIEYMCNEVISAIVKFLYSHFK